MAIQQVKSTTLTSSAWRRNLIINGNFDIWQRGTSKAVTSGEYLADRWLTGQVGTTSTVSRQSFTFGQAEVPNNPNYYMRYVVTSSAGASNYCHAIHRAEFGTRNLSGKEVTLSFWAKADSNKNIALEFTQSFGTGGSPSSSVSGLGVTRCSLTTTWQKFVINTYLPSVVGKTFGSNGDDHLSLSFWFDAGSNWASRTNSLGQQSGTFDIAQVQLEEGTEATPFEIRPFAEELRLCQRYFEKSYPVTVNPGTAGLEGKADNMMAINTSQAYGIVPFIVEKRAYPTMVLYSYNGTANKVSPNNNSTDVGTTMTVTAGRVSTRNFIQIQDSGTGLSVNAWYWFGWTASAEL